MSRRLVLALCAVAALLGACVTSLTARADDNSPQALFASGTKALQESRAADAIAAFEALADRGVVDPVASFDRGLAYASRVRIGAEVPGDLGRAAHGFEEARALSKDPKLVADAARALEVVRSEVARRRARAGQPVEVDYGRSLGRTVASLIPEDAWAGFAVLASASLAIALFVRWLSRSARGRVAGAIVTGVSAPTLFLAVAMTLASRHDRHDLREAVVLADARPIDGRGITIAGATPLPEGARVEVIDMENAAARVRFGALDARLPRASIRELARHD